MSSFPQLLCLLAASLSSCSFGNRVEIGANIRSHHVRTFKCDTQIDKVTVQMAKIKTIMRAMEAACGQGADCLSDKSTDKVLDDVSDAENAQALVESVESLQAMLGEVEECRAPSATLAELQTRTAGTLRDIRQSLANLAAKNTKVTQIVENTNDLAHTTLLPEVFRAVDHSRDAALKTQLMLDLNTTEEAQRPRLPSNKMLKMPENLTTAQTILQWTLADAPSFSSMLRQKLTGAVKRMWCKTPGKRCKHRKGEHHRSCYRIVRSDDSAENGYSWENPLDPNAPKINIKKFELAHGPVITSEEEWGLCLVNHEAAGVNATEAQFAKRQDAYRAWQYPALAKLSSVYESPASGLVQVHGRSDNSSAMQSGNILVSAANLVSTTVYYALSLVTWVMNNVLILAMAFWKVGASFVGYFLGDKMSWIFMQPACIAYKAVMFVPDLIRTIAGHVMNWCTRMQNDGIGGEDIQWSSAYQMSRTCFHNYPRSADPRSAIERQQEREGWQPIK